MGWGGVGWGGVGVGVPIRAGRSNTIYHLVKATI